MINAVIFDMDGLLINSEPLWDDVDRILLKRRGYLLQGDILRDRLGTGQQATVELFKTRFNLKDDIPTLLSERQETFSLLFDNNPQLMLGAKQVIKFFASKKLRLGIATGGHSEKKTRSFLRHFKLEDYFDSITTGNEVTKGKPAPDIFLLEASKLEVNPSGCLVFEDAPSGVEAGKKAGMKVIGVNSNRQIRKKLKERKADNVFSSLVDISTTVLVRYIIR